MFIRRNELNKGRSKLCSDGQYKRQGAGTRIQFTIIIICSIIIVIIIIILLLLVVVIIIMITIMKKKNVYIFGNTVICIQICL